MKTEGLEAIAEESYKHMMDILNQDHIGIQILVLINILAHIGADMGDKSFSEIQEQLKIKFEKFKKKKKNNLSEIPENSNLNPAVKSVADSVF